MHIKNSSVRKLLKQVEQINISDCCSLVVRDPGYRSRDPGFDSRRYQILWEVVSLERGPLSLVSTNEELPGRNCSGSGLENREYGRGDPLRWPRDALYPQKLALTSSTSGGRSVGIVRLLTKATEFCLFVFTIASINLHQQWKANENICFQNKCYRKAEIRIC
jgi:hypothetical protein